MLSAFSFILADAVYSGCDAGFRMEAGCLLCFFPFFMRFPAIPGG